MLIRQQTLCQPMTLKIQEVEGFVMKKMRDLEAYDEKLDKVEHYKALMGREAMTREEFMF